MNIAIYHDDPIKSEEIALGLRTKTEGEVLMYTDLKKFVEESFSPDKKVIAAIVFVKLLDKEIFGKVLKINQTKQNIPIILVGPENITSNPYEKDTNLIWLNRVNIARAIPNAFSRLKSAGRFKATETNQEYCKIATSVLKLVYPLKGHVFIKLGADKYIKLRNEGDTFDDDDFEKYTTEKKLLYLYIKTDDIGEFIEKFSDEVSRENATEPLNVENVAKSSGDVFSTLKEIGNKVGFSETVQKVAKTYIDTTLKAIGRSPRLGQLLKKISAENKDYTSQHVFITSALACGIASKMDWGSQTTFLKLSTAAFMHDIAITNDAMTAMDGVSSEDVMKYDKKDLQMYLEHPFKGSEMSRQFKEVPADVDIIILQHHEKPDGKGFPRKLTGNQIAPLSAVFIIAHEMAQFFFFEKPDPAQIVEKIEKLKLQYEQGNFKKALIALEIGLTET